MYKANDRFSISNTHPSTPSSYVMRERAAGTMVLRLEDREL